MANPEQVRILRQGIQSSIIFPAELEVWELRVDRLNSFSFVLKADFIQAIIHLAQVRGLHLPRGNHVLENESLDLILSEIS